MGNKEKLLSLLSDGTEGLLLTSRENRMYASQFDIAEGVCVLARGGAFFFTDSRYLEAAQKGMQGFCVKLTDREHSYTQRINEAVSALGLSSLGIEEDSLTYGEFLRYEQNLSVRLRPMQQQIDSVRSVKEPWELDIMRKAQDITDRTFSEILGKIKAGMTEKQLQAELIYALSKNGADGLSFDPIVVSGPNTSLPHGVAGDRVICEGDFVTLDFGARFHGYCADMTRTVAVGSVSEEMQKVYDTVLRAQTAAISQSRAGMTGRQIDAVARDMIREAGYGEYFGHSYGHCLGIAVHEAPSCSPSCDTPMRENMICSAEPGIYLPGKFGVRIEDVVIFCTNGCENITHSPKNLIIV